MKKINCLIMVLALFVASESHAYKQRVHMMLTEYATNQSILSNKDLWDSWGMSSVDAFLYQHSAVEFHPIIKDKLN